MTSGSPYGKGAPTYPGAELQRDAIEGRLKVATGIRQRAEMDGNARRLARWRQIETELPDRLLEVRGR